MLYLKSTTLAPLGTGWTATGAFISRGGTGEGVKAVGDRYSIAYARASPLPRSCFRRCARERDADIKDNVCATHSSPCSRFTPALCLLTCSSSEVSTLRSRIRQLGSSAQREILRRLSKAIASSRQDRLRQSLRGNNHGCNPAAGPGPVAGQIQVCNRC
jgi:hypothetical protein